MDRETPKDTQARANYTLAHTNMPPQHLLLSFSQTKGFFSQLSGLAHEGLTAARCLYHRDFYLQPFGLGWNGCTLLCGAKCMPAMLNSSLSVQGNCKNTTTRAHTCTRTPSTDDILQHRRFVLQDELSLDQITVSCTPSWNWGEFAEPIAECYSIILLPLRRKRSVNVCVSAVFMENTLNTHLW